MESEFYEEDESPEVVERFRGMFPAPDMVLSYRVAGSLLIYQSEARPHGFRKDTPENRAWLEERGYELRPTVIQFPTTSDVASD